MSRRRLRRCTTTAAWTVLLLVIGTVTDLRAAPSLKRSDFYRYRTWVAARDAAPDAESRERFPYGAVSEAGGVDLVPDKLGTAARSLVNLEDVLVREWTSAKSFSPDQTLGTARSYRDVGEYGAALTWYRRSAQSRGSAGALPAEIRHEMFACAVMTGDSIQVTTELLNLVGLARLDPVVDTLELAFRWMVVHDPGRNLDLLAQKVEGQLPGLGPRIRFWYAYVQAMDDQREACLAQLLRLVADADAPRVLEPAQADWVLRTIPDILYLQERRDDALRLYAALADSHGEGGAWARYQLANMHLLAGEYDRAQVLFGDLCDDQAGTGWRARACTMAGLVDRLAQIREGGETYGIDGMHRR